LLTGWNILVDVCGSGVIFESAVQFLFLHVTGKDTKLVAERRTWVALVILLGEWLDVVSE